MVSPGQQKNNVLSNDWDHIGVMPGPLLGQFKLYLIVSTKATSLRIAKFGSMDLHGDILQPWGAT